MHTPEPPHRAALGVCLVAAFLLLIGVGPIVASRAGNTADASELHTATDTSATSTVTSPSTSTTTPPVPVAEEVAITPPPTSSTTSSTTSTTVAPPPPPPPPPPPEPEPVAVSPYASRTDIPDSYWDRMAQCETGGNWAHFPGARWSGGLGIYTPGWISFGGGEFAPSAGEASREQQIVVANRIAAQGLGGWGCLDSVGYP